MIFVIFSVQLHGSSIGFGSIVERLLYLVGGVKTRLQRIKGMIKTSISFLQKPAVL